LIIVGPLSILRTPSILGMFFSDGIGHRVVEERWELSISNTVRPVKVPSK